MSENRFGVFGSKSHFNFIQTFDTVHLENHSNKDLVINNIEVVDRNTVPQVTIDTDFDQDLFGPNKGTPFFTFDVQLSYAPTTVEILNLSAVGKPNVFLKGTIDNPVGMTRIHDDRGAIVPGSATAVIVSNTFDLASGLDNVGSVLGRVRLDLVQSAGLSTSAKVSAGGNVWLDVRGVLRDPNLVAFSPSVGTISGKNVDVFLRGAVKQTMLDPNANAYVEVSETHPSTLTFTNNHFRLDNGFVSPPLSVFGIGGDPISRS